MTPDIKRLECVQKCLDDLKNGECPEIVEYAILCVLGVEK